MKMEAIKHQPWRISVVAKAKSFHFKFTASKILPSSTFYGTRFSLLIKLRRFFLKVKSETGDSARRRCRGGSSLKFKFLKLLEKFHLKRRVREKIATTTTDTAINNNKKKKNSANFWNHRQISFPMKSKPEEWKMSSGGVVGNLIVSIYRSVSANHKGRIIIIYTSKLLIYFALLFKNYVMRKANFIIILVAFVVYLIRLISVSDNLQDLVWRAWNQFTIFN